MKCERCGAKDPVFFYVFRRTYYCRKCIVFGKVEVRSSIPIPVVQKREIDCTYTLGFELTKEQQAVIQKIRLVLKNKQKVLIYAACGAGKTEITMDSIQTYLRSGKKVGYAISRRQVVLEIAERMQTAFRNVEVTKVCGGYTTKTDGDLIVCTTHQLYRYHQCFDLLILDEIPQQILRQNTAKLSVQVRTKEQAEAALLGEIDELNI